MTLSTYKIVKNLLSSIMDKSIGHRLGDSTSDDRSLDSLGTRRFRKGTVTFFLIRIFLFLRYALL